MARKLDDLAKYEDFTSTVLPDLQKAVKEKWSVEKIYKHFEGFVAARMITAALTDPDVGKALLAGKDVLDRSMGRAKERVDVSHKYSKLSDDELDSLLISVESTVEDK